MVVGAGRGPLVDATLKAAADAERVVKIYAVEKNPGAVNTYVNFIHTGQVAMIVGAN